MKLFRMEHIKAEEQIRAKIYQGFELDTNSHWNSTLKNFILLLEKINLSYYDFIDNRNLLSSHIKSSSINDDDKSLVEYIFKSDLEKKEKIDLNFFNTEELLHIIYRLDHIFLEEMNLFHVVNKNQALNLKNLDNNCKS